MTITTEEHKQSFIDCINSALSDENTTLARSLIAECEIYSVDRGVELLTLDEVIHYYIQVYEVSTYTMFRCP